MTHGNFVHGFSGAYNSTYGIWKAMWQRCTNGNHKDWNDYGGRGIGVCERWQDFKMFLLDMGERPEGLELERVDNNKGYEPDNCRWATRAEQIANSRIRHDNKSGLKGVTFKVGRRDFVWAYGNSAGTQIILYRGTDFFEACCVRKSWENRQT